MRRAAGKRPALEFGGDKEKFLVKFFSKNLRGVEQSSTALRGVRDRRSCLPILQKKGDVCPPLGTAQKPLPQGLRNGNGRITPKTQETSHFYDLPTWANHYGKWSRHLYDSSTWSNHRTRIKPDFFDDSSIFSSQVGGAPCEGRTGRRPRTQVPGERKC